MDPAAASAQNLRSQRLMHMSITTITTVGFGDITPRTDLGQALASAMMVRHDFGVALLTNGPGASTHHAVPGTTCSINAPREPRDRPAAAWRGAAARAQADATARLLL